MSDRSNKITKYLVKQQKEKFAIHCVVCCG